MKKHITISKRKNAKPIETSEIYFTSSINSELPKFEILESSMNFNKKEFLEDVKQQMKELEIDVYELATALYLSNDKTKALLKGNKKLTEENIKELKRILHLS